MRKAKSEKKMSLKTKVNILTIITNNKILFSYLEINRSIKNIFLIITNANSVNYVFDANQNNINITRWLNNNIDIDDLNIFI
jgi:hypothetical protein